MKQITNKAFIARCGKIAIIVPGAENIAMLTGGEKTYYNAGGYGWNWSAYHLDNVVIVDGYRNLPGCTRSVSFADSEKIFQHISQLKTQDGRMRAAERLINKLAK